MSKQGKFEVRNPEIEADLKGIGRTIASQLPEGWGFMLFIFSFGEGGSNFYISNAQRPDVIAAMKEFIERNEQ